MKKLMLGLTVIAAAASFSANACQQEAQFSGTVKNVKDCSFEIEFSSFHSSFVCPLDIDEAVQVRFHDSSCSLKNGDQVSGILVKTSEEEIVIE